jgi:GNAT superfamily N-acetyltransferase
MPSYFRRKATASDLAVISAWLQYESEQATYGVDGGYFWSNIDLIKEGHRRGDITALIDLDYDRAVAFCLSAGDSLEILAVRADLRRRGLGRMFAAGMIDEARRAGMMGLRAQCAPRSSIPFWESLGFAKVDGFGDEYWVALPFRGRTELSPEAAACSIQIQLWDQYQETQMGSPHETPAAMTSKGILLENHFVECLPDGDVKIQIQLNRREVFLRKVKYRESQDLGIERGYPWVRVTRLALPVGSASLSALGEV